MALVVPGVIDPTIVAGPLTVKQAPLMLTNPYLPFEAGYALNSDGMHHVAASTYMPNISGDMIEWFFGWITNTEQYKLWHPRDHVYSEWVGPRGNSQYVGGYHLVYEYIGGILNQLRISFKDPGEYFGPTWKEDFKKNNISAAICGRVGLWEGKGKGIEATDIGHLVHLIHKECNECGNYPHEATDDITGVRMRSRFWLGDFPGMTSPQQRAESLPTDLPKGLMQHATEEMAILAKILPDLYRRETQGAGPKRQSVKVPKLTTAQKSLLRRKQEKKQ
jgi:hypothetical protein